MEADDWLWLHLKGKKPKEEDKVEVSLLFKSFEVRQFICLKGGEFHKIDAAPCC